MAATIQIRPQPGPQTKFLSTSADIAVYGGSAGGGKTYALLIEFTRHIRNPLFGAVIFRRTSEQIRIEGGLWDEAVQMYVPLGARSREQQLDFKFPSGSAITLDSLQHEQDKLQFQGAQICGMGFDELTHFSESQFFYLLSRNRSTCGVRPYVRATTNPDAHSWVKEFLAPWLDVQHPDAAESGEIRWMTRDGGEITWHRQYVDGAKSVTFIRASIYDNRKLLEADPGYLDNLKALSLVDRRRLLDGDWDVVEGGNMFKPEWFRVVDHLPDTVRSVRYWDMAASEVKKGTDPDWTVGVKMSATANGQVVVEDVQRIRATPLEVENLVRRTAAQDGENVPIRMEQEPGSSGVAVIDHYRRKVLMGYDFTGYRSTGPKPERAKPYSAHAEHGHVLLMRAHWNQSFVNEHSPFPTDGIHDDQVDAASGAFRFVARSAIELSFT